VDRCRDELRLPLSGGGDDLCGEATREHERLRLQRPVEEPQQPERDLQLTASHGYG